MSATWVYFPLRAVRDSLLFFIINWMLVCFLKLSVISFYHISAALCFKSVNFIPSPIFNSRGPHICDRWNG